MTKKLTNKKPNPSEIASKNASYPQKPLASLTRKEKKTLKRIAKTKNQTQNPLDSHANQGQNSQPQKALDSHANKAQNSSKKIKKNKNFAAENALNKGKVDLKTRTKNNNLPNLTNKEKMAFKKNKKNRNFQQNLQKNKETSESYNKAQTLYQEHARKQLDKYGVSKADQSWMRKIMLKGTVKDKISALCIYIRDNPKCTLKCIENMLDYCEKINRKDSLSSINALKNLFIEVLLPKNVLLNYAEKLKGLQNKSSLADTILIDAYYENCLKELYFKFLKILENKAKDPITFLRRNMITYLAELITKKPEKENFILNILINKFAETDRKLITHLNSCLGNVLYKRPTLTSNAIKEIEAFIYRPNLDQTAQLYALNFLNTLQIEKMSPDTLTELINLFFKLFKKIIRINDEGVIASKLTTNILKGINKIFPSIKENIKKIFPNYMEEIDNLYLIIHQTSNFKIKIQILLFIYQFLNAEKALNDRYYRVLYELLLSEEIWHSSLTELFFDLLYFSLKQDSSITRIKAFVKRLLQNSMHGDPAFLITSLIFISRIFQIHAGVKTLITYAEAIDENDNEDEHFVDINESDDEKPQIKSKKLKKLKEIDEENQQKQKDSLIEPENKTQHSTIYDPFKRDPLYCNADKTCLWEMVGLLNHYHPNVKKLAETLIDDIQKSNNILEYSGNPLLDFTLANFLDRFTFKKNKKKDSAGRKSLITKNKLRMSKIKDPLSIEEVSKLKDNEIREDEKYFLKYFEQKKIRNAFKLSKTSQKKRNNFDEEELEEFADEVIESKMNELNPEEELDEDDDFDEFLKGELEDEEDLEEEEERFSDNENLEGMFEEEEEIEDREKFQKKKVMKKKFKSKK